MERREVGLGVCLCGGVSGGRRGGKQGRVGRREKFALKKGNGGEEGIGTCGLTS